MARSCITPLALAALALWAAPAGAESVNGTSGDDTLYGTADADVIKAGAGTDFIYGEPLAGMSAPVAIRRVSRTAKGRDGIEADVAGINYQPVISPDGTKVAFVGQRSWSMATATRKSMSS